MAIVDLYFNLKKKLKSFNTGTLDNNDTVAPNRSGNVQDNELMA
jgi:hypothetical protein